jgi:very-short-patch-repair endonuclease
LASRAKERGTLTGVQTTLETISVALRPAASSSQAISEVLDNVRALIDVLEEAIEAIAGAGYRDDYPLASIPQVLVAAEQYGLSVRHISARDSVRSLLGDGFKGMQTDLEPVEKAVEFAERIALGVLPAKTAGWVLSENQRSRLHQLRHWLSETASSLSVLRGTVAEIAAVTGCPTWSAAAGAESLDSYRDVAGISLAYREELPRWVHFVRVRRQASEEGLSKLTTLADSNRMAPAHLVPAFRFLFYDSLARGIFAERPALSGLTGLTVAEVRKQFAKSDREAIVLYRQRAATLTDRRSVPYGSQMGPVGSWTDLALVVHEINKQRRHLPIRQLIRRAGKALQALKPCFMMGPLSVAQYLAPGELSFDMIVMDEASQLKPEDAVGAIARGGQIVIVGDPKQLPPTTFFQRAAMDAEAEEDQQSRTVAEEGESILDVASTLYQPVRRLRWHYRSRHHSLIAFSNREFYQGDLVIFPSAYHEHSDLGVKYHPVLDGSFENGRNPREAAAVVDSVLNHMEQRPNESLGVVTLNFEQGELIEELLDQRLRSEPFALAYEDKMRSGFEPFFVKNLENVQGDERDVIFISATYGPDSRGNQYQRFGPINGANGHRRLNVLFTRAKKRTEVFSSLDPDKIQTSPGSAWGLRALKKYLIFARSGVLDGPDEGAAQPTNDFERSVGSVLKEKGYDVVPQVGVAGFFIDLAVKHPTKPGSYLLGIECDGASYHSGRSARDRDRLREEVLVNLGWKIYRVWSTDWFKSRATEVPRLLKHIEDLLANDPDYRKQMSRQARTDALRRSLVNLREELFAEFPESPPDKGLLRDELLDDFIARRPKTRDDWFRLIPQNLRANTDSKQVGRFLQRVLEVISSAEE